MLQKFMFYVMDELPEKLHPHVQFRDRWTNQRYHIIFDSRKKSRAKVIISKKSLGMGVDFQGLFRIIFFGLPHSILDVLEEIGRAGRDCENVVALLLYNYHRVHCEPVMRKLFQCNDCRGTRMMNSELENVKSYSGGCSCCDLFQNICCCGNCTLLLWKNCFQAPPQMYLMMVMYRRFWFRVKHRARII